MSKTKECFAYNTKIIETPTTKEVYIYENPIFIHSKEKADLTDTSNRKKFDEMSALISMLPGLSSSYFQKTPVSPMKIIPHVSQKNLK